MKKIFAMVAAVFFATSMMAADLLNIDFTKGQGSWTINDVNKDTLSYVWKQDATYGMKATAYVKAAHATESWLISPAIDLSNVTKAELAFEQALNKGAASSVSVKAKAGEGEWTVVAVDTMPAGTNWNFIDSKADLSAYAGKADVQVAFVYTSTKESAATWEIKSVAVNDGVIDPTTIPDVTFLPADFAGKGTTSTGSEVTVTKDEVTVSTNKGFGHEAALRVYKSGTFSIVSATEQIGKIVFEFGSYQGQAKDGGLKSEIIVNAKEFSVASMESAAWFEKIDIFFGEYEKPEEETVDTLSVAEALEIGKQLADGGVTEKEYMIIGYVTGMTNNKGEETTDGGWAQYQNQCMWLADTKDGGTTAATAFFVYQGKATEQVTKGAKISFTCQIKNYKGTIENSTPKMPVTILEKGEAPATEKLDTISVAQALEIGYALLDNAVTEKKYVIDGYVSSIETYYDSQYKNETFWIADALGSRAASNADGAFYVYRGKPDTEKEIGLNAHVYVTVLITKYSKECKEPVIENSKSADVTVVAQGLEEKIDTITVAQALEIGQKMEQGQATDNRYAITGYVSSIDVPFSEQYKNETFWITDTKGEKTSDKAKAFYVYRGKPNVEKEIGLDAKITIVCKIKNFKGTIENDGMGIQFEVLEEGVAPEIKTITVTEAIALGMALEDGAYSDDIYVVKGFATKAYAPDSCKTSQNVYMADFPEAYGTFYAYNCSPDELVKDGDYIYVQGKIQKYVSAKGTTIEIGGGSAVHGEPEITSVNVAEATAIAKGLDLTPVKDSIVTVTAPALYEVTGYVIYVSKNGEYFMLADDANATESEFMAYKCYGDENVELAVGDQVVVLGAIQRRHDGTTDTDYYQIGEGVWVLAGSQGIENVVLTEKAQKVVVDGALYIVRDNKMYNVQGVQVR